MARTRLSELTRAFSEGLRLPATAARILSVLARARRALDVSEIVRRVQRSERSVRHNLSLLIRKGLLQRREFVTSSRKLAFAYALRPVEDLVQVARREIRRTVSRIEAVARRLRETPA